MPVPVATKSTFRNINAILATPMTGPPLIQIWVGGLRIMLRVQSPAAEMSTLKPFLPPESGIVAKL